MESPKLQIASLSIAEKQSVYELQLQMVWNRISTSKTFRTVDNKELKVVSPGTWNVEPGADFLNAKVILDGKEVVGDVEVHRKSSDWFEHNHDKHEQYKNVILHVVDTFIPERSPSLTTLVLPLPSINKNFSVADKFNYGKCADFFRRISDTELHKLFRSLGLRRCLIKVYSLLEEMLLYGAEYTFMKHIFESIGYKKNREAFLQLFEYYQQYDVNSDKEIMAVLWGLSGFLPEIISGNIADEMKDFVKECWRIWWQLRKEAHPPIKWYRSGVRPLNSPERRVAALTLLCHKLGRQPLKFLVDKIHSLNSGSEIWKTIEEIFILNDSLWNRYTNFRDRRKYPAAVLGKNRTIDIAANIIAPSLYAYGILHKNEILKEKAKALFLNLPKTDTNRILKIASHKWFIPPSRSSKIFRDAASQQGALLLYKSGCDKIHSECDKCLLYQPISE